MADIPHSTLVQADKLLMALNLRKAILDSLVGSDEQLVAQMFVAWERSGKGRLGRACCELEGPVLAEVLATARNIVHTTPRAEKGDAFRDFLDALLEGVGGRVLVAVVSSAGASLDDRMAALATLKLAVERQLALADADGADAVRATCESLVLELWRPLLVGLLDPPGMELPDAMDPEVLRAIFDLLQTARVPVTAAGGEAGAALAPEVIEVLVRLSRCSGRCGRTLPPELAAAEAVRALNTLQILVELHTDRRALNAPPEGGANEAHVQTVAAAFGGCRLLRETLARMPSRPPSSRSSSSSSDAEDCEGDEKRADRPFHGMRQTLQELSQMGREVLRLWDAERKRLLARWQEPRRDHVAWSRLEALAKAVALAEHEGMLTTWPEPQLPPSEVPLEPTHESSTASWSS